MSEALGFLMLLTLLGAIFVGFPISFTLLFVALFFGLVGLGPAVFDLAYIQILGLMKEEVFTSIPLFILMGYLTESTGMMERLFSSCQVLLRSVKGSLLLVVIITATIFAMSTGIVGSAVTVLGIAAGPALVKAGYDARMSAGAIAAGGTLGILIPPSIMLVVMGPVLGVSVADLYAGAILPGFLLAVVYAAYCFIRASINPSLCPALPADRSSDGALKELIKGLLPLIFVIGSTMGAILFGVATPSEAAALGCMAAYIWGLFTRTVGFSELQKASVSTMTTTSMVLFLAMGANVFGAVFSSLGSAAAMNGLLQSLPLGANGLLLTILALVFLLGWPFEWPAIVLVFLPMFQPTIATLGVDGVWFGVLVAVVLQTAYLSPPVAMSAYYLKSVVPAWEMRTIYRGMADFMVLQVIVVLIVFFVPSIATWLPGKLAQSESSVVISDGPADLLQDFSLDY